MAVLQFEVIFTAGKSFHGRLANKSDGSYPSHPDDVSETFSLKLAALGCHVSQVGQNFELVKQWGEEWERKIGESRQIPLAEDFRRVKIMAG